MSSATSEGREEGTVPVAEWFAHKTVMLTGGTGFLGKLLIEKLLFSCPELRQVYILIRSKKGMSPEQRLSILKDNIIFNRIKEKDPNLLQKIIPVVGDMSEPRLGLSADDENTLKEKVEVVIHSAATVKFNEPLSTAININVDGTGRLIELCRQMKQLQVFVYISTAYANSNRPRVDEVLYPAPATLDAVRQHLHEHGDLLLHTQQLLGDRPNTYTYTKALTEALIATECRDVPVVIMRPSIVTATAEEPLRGWLENWNGATAVVTAICRGMLRVMPGEDDYVVDLMPADLVVNMTLVAAAHAGVARDKLAIYNCCSGNGNPITLRDTFRLFYRESALHKEFDGVPYPSIIFTQRRWLLQMLVCMLEMLPAYALDMWRRLTRKPTMFVNAHQQVKSVRCISEYLTANTWDMRADNASALAARAPRTFHCDVRSVAWPVFIADYCRGVAAHLLNRKKKSQ